MSEVAQLLVAGASADLSARAGRVALAVAGVLEARCTPESGAAEASAFLRSWALTAGATTRAPLVTPLDRLVARFGLSHAEHDLLVLAGLPEEHEGLATTFRGL